MPYLLNSVSTHFIRLKLDSDDEVLLASKLWEIESLLEIISEIEYFWINFAITNWFFSGRIIISIIAITFT